jgi:hypothetical protein
LLVQQADRLGPLHRRNWVFADADFGMVDPPGGLELSDDLASEITQPDETVAQLGRW